MTYRRIDMLNELGRLISGAQTKLPVSEIARWAMPWVKFGMSQVEADKEIQELERIYGQQ